MDLICCDVITRLTPTTHRLLAGIQSQVSPDPRDRLHKGLSTSRQRPWSATFTHCIGPGRSQSSDPTKRQPLGPLPARQGGGPATPAWQPRHGYESGEGKESWAWPTPPHQQARPFCKWGKSRLKVNPPAKTTMAQINSSHIISLAAVRKPWSDPRLQCN